MDIKTHSLRRLSRAEKGAHHVQDGDDTQDAIWGGYD